MDAPVKALNTEKAKALQAALAQIEKQFGKGSIMRLGDGEVIDDIQVVSTGSLGLDIALGVGGLPRGRVVEIYGPESSGKTTLTLQVIAEMQKLGGTCAFIDAEHALDTQYAQKLGVNLQELLICQPDTGEQALEIVDALVRSGSVDLIVIDSVAALTPKAEIEGEMGDSLPGLQARLMSQALRKLTATIKQDQHHGHLHQPDPHEDRRDVRQPRDHHRRQRAQVLRLGAPRHPPHRQRSRRATRSSATRPRSRSSRTRSRRRSRRPSSTSSTAKASAARARSSTWASKPSILEKSRRLVRLQRREDRPGQGQRARVPAREPRPGARDREQGARSHGHAAACRWTSSPPTESPHGNAARDQPAAQLAEARRALRAAPRAQPGRAARASCCAGSTKRRGPRRRSTRCSTSCSRRGLLATSASSKPSCAPARPLGNAHRAGAAATRRDARCRRDRAQQCATPNCSGRAQSGPAASARRPPTPRSAPGRCASWRRAASLRPSSVGC